MKIFGVAVSYKTSYFKKVMLFQTYRRAAPLLLLPCMMEAAVDTKITKHNLYPNLSPYGFQYHIDIA